VKSRSRSSVLQRRNTGAAAGERALLLYIHPVTLYTYTVIVAYRYRVKSLSGLLNQQVRAVNYVWNYCNDTQKHALKWNKCWPSGFDLNVLTTGCAKELGLHSGTVNAVCEQ